jgi:hypothetical protein
MDAVAIRSGKKQWRYLKIQLLRAIVLQAYLKEARVWKIHVDAFDAIRPPSARSKH